MSADKYTGGEGQKRPSRNGLRAADLPGTGSGRRVVADPNGDRTARRKYQRETGEQPEPMRALAPRDVWDGEIA